MDNKTIQAKAQPTPPPAKRVVCIGDLHGQVNRSKALWGKIEAKLGKKGLGEATVIFLGDYCDRGFDTKGLLDWLIEIKRQRDEAGQRTVFLCGNHDLGMAAYLGTEWLPATWTKEFDIDKDTLSPNWTTGFFKNKVKGGMLYLGRRWGGSDIYNADKTFSSYGVEFKFTNTAREAFQQAVPRAHKRFLSSLAWCHDEPLAFEPGRLIAVHAGIDPEAKLDVQLAALAARDLTAKILLEGGQLGRYAALQGRDNVLPLHPDLKGKAWLVSGHHGFSDQEGLRLICDESGGMAGRPLEAVVLPGVLKVRVEKGEVLEEDAKRRQAEAFGNAKRQRLNK